ncbi:RsmB/NOP family class I SAM-dependent RNA methyltransferase [Candidatus Woesearchaeota archaeon]|jgi:tRNA (cytosine49-C5)-methyltransferase|nr:RsmB/NOP family class I SAM-dependent RNA methyltransferase [Candidatus Woesearchaeota archaeon]
MSGKITSEKIEFKEKFIERYSKLTDFEKFKEYSLEFLRRSIRVNTLKTSVAELKKSLEKNWLLEPIPWCKDGFWIEHKGEEKEDENGNIELVKRRDVGNIPEHQLGYFYIQEAASMIPPLVLQPKPGDMVLDMCASPGSKTTQIGMYMDNEGILVANDYKYDRIKSLGLNVQRCGLSNCVITLMMGHLLSKLQENNKEGVFDKILVDAPCSGTGTIRKSLKTLRIWNPNVVRRIAGQQKQLIDTGFKLLKKGGTLVYSTCTLEPEEDEGIISWLLDKYDGESEESKCMKAKVEKIELKGLVRSKPIMEFEGTKYNSKVKDCLRIWPQDNNTEGFFVCKIQKI